MDAVIVPSRKPVVPILADLEKVFTSKDKGVMPLSGLVSRTQEKRVIIRYSPTPEQRECLQAGGDIFLSLLTYGHPLPPLLMVVSGELDEASVVEEMQLIPGV